MALTELQQINALIGLSKNIDGWPNTLADLGYILDRIELSLKFPDRDQPGSSIVVTPDLLFVADLRNNSLVTELKSGRFQDLVQADKLAKLTPKDIIKYGRVTLPDASNLLSHQVSVAVVINHEFLGEYQFAFNEANHSVSLISFSDEIIKKEHGKLKDSKLDKVLNDGVDISRSRRPERLIRILPTCSDKYDVIRVVVDEFNLAWVNNKRALSLNDIANSIFGSLWATIDEKAQKVFLNEAKDIMKDMEQTEFNRYLKPTPEKKDEWKLHYLPGSVAPKQRTKSIKTFHDCVVKYKQRRKHNAPYKARSLSQLSMEDIEGFSIDTEDTDVSD